MRWDRFSTTTVGRGEGDIGRLVYEVRWVHPVRGPRVRRTVDEAEARVWGGHLPEARVYRLVPGRMPEELVT